MPRDFIALPYFRYDEGLGEWEDATQFPEEFVPLKDLVFVQYNIWFGAHKMQERMRAIIEEVKKVKADFVCFQEVKTPILIELLENPYVQEHYYVSDITGRTLGSYGVIQMSRFKFQTLKIHRMKTNLGRSALLATFAVENTKETFAVVTAHLESYPKDVLLRKEQMFTIFELLKGFKHRFFTADFNFSEEGEDGIFPLEFTDVWATLYPEEPGYTFNEENPMRSDMPPGAKRIDRILVHSDTWKPKEARLLGNKPISEIDKNLRPSDHYGVSATFSL